MKLEKQFCAETAPLQANAVSAFPHSCGITAPMSASANLYT